uniref:Protein kinase domain-containing protein n=1 Tax=viral metagenome TaxID=1070528 RepID=A0A6C0EM65_9ZZZZ
MSYNLEKYKLPDLKKMAQKMGLPLRRSRSEMISDITAAFQEYEDYKKDKLDKYSRKHQLGQKGKEGTTYLVVDKHGRELAMKTFRKAKSSRTLKKEYTLQKRASEAGISPKVYDYDTVSKYIVMEKMDCHLYEIIEKQKGILHKYQQKRIVEIFSKLDECGVFHNDANICNYMMKGKDIYIIDFGFAKEIDSRLCKQLGTRRPNMKLMLLGFILKLKELGLPRESYTVLKRYVTIEDCQRFQL